MVVPCCVYYKAIQKDAVLVSFYIDSIEKSMLHKVSTDSTQLWTYHVGIPKTKKILHLNLWETALLQDLDSPYNDKFRGALRQNVRLCTLRVPKLGLGKKFTICNSFEITKSQNWIYETSVAVHFCFSTVSQFSVSFKILL